MSDWSRRDVQVMVGEHARLISHGAGRQPAGHGTTWAKADITTSGNLSVSLAGGGARGAGGGELWFAAVGVLR